MPAADFQDPTEVSKAACARARSAKAQAPSMCGSSLLASRLLRYRVQLLGVLKPLSLGKVCISLGTYRSAFKGSQKEKNLNDGAEV